jgi:hypothetical protein
MMVRYQLVIRVVVTIGHLEGDCAMAAKKPAAKKPAAKAPAKKPAAKKKK